MAVITLKSPGDREAMTVRMFPKDVEESKHFVFERNLGKSIVIDIDVDQYQGKTQYRLGYDFTCVPFDSFIRNEHEKLSGSPHGAVKPAKAS